VVATEPRFIAVDLNLLPPDASYLAGRIQERVMADRASLGFLGFIFGGITAAVMLMAVTVVAAHVDGRLMLDAPAGTVSIH
jgi:hypothetical protein